MKVARQSAKFGRAMGQHFTHVLKMLGPADLRSRDQVTKRGTMLGPNFNYLYAPVTHTVPPPIAFKLSGCA